MGVYVFSRDVLLEAIEQEDAADFGRQIIPAALGRYRVNAHLFRGYWADVGTVASFYDANIMLTRPGAPFKLLRPAPSDLHARALPAGRAAQRLHRARRDRRRRLLHRALDDRGSRSSASGPTSRAARRSADRCCSAPTSTRPTTTARSRRDRPRLGIGRDVVLDRVIVDKNARIGDGAQLVNEAGVQHADGDGYFIRDGVIVVPKDGVIKPGTRDIG